jgi:hypothetical protein
MNARFHSLRQLHTMHLLVRIALVILLLTAFLFRLEAIPPVSWDEGWTLSVARNWLERGHYGRLLNGNLAPGGLEAAVTVTAPVALSFRLLGIGVWQGRLVGVIFLFGALASTYFLAKYLFSQSVANFAIGVLLLTGVWPEWHPVVMARQVLGEIPMLFYLVTGYLLFYLSLSRCLLLLPLAVSSWAMAIITKAQVRPFWIVSLLVPLMFTTYCRRWRLTGLLVTALLSSMAMATVFLWLKDQMLPALPTAKVVGLYNVTAVVTDLGSRKLAAAILFFLLPTVFGLAYEIRRVLISSIWCVTETTEAIVRFILWSLVVSWLAWYLLLSNGVLRYAFPVMFVGSIFLGKLLHDLAENRFFSHRTTDSKNGIFSQRFVAKVFIAMSSVATITMVLSFYFAPPDQAIKKVIHFIETRTPPNALIETYESEIHFLTDRRYHYPPDQVHVDLMRRTFPSVEYFTIEYDPLAADPDYLVVGPRAKGWNLYGPVLQSGGFRLLQDYSRYQIYERVR